jgi:CheY-like chemotaxis protein
MNSVLVGKRVLLAEGDALVRDAVGLMLRALKMEVVVAADGQEALALYQQQPFDAVVADYLMSPMRGDELAEAIKPIDPDQRVILITGYPERAMASERTYLHVDQILRKPCSLEELAAALRGPTPAPQLATQE